jgi:hypothetical protein
VKLKASHERHCSRAVLCFPMGTVTLNQMSCGAFLQRYPSKPGNRHVKASFGTPPATIAYACIVQEDLFSDFFAYRSMAKPLMPPRKPSSRLVCCLCSGIRVFASESAWALVSDEALAWWWLLALE